jgi:RNA polymerase sigma factor (sigma-70 family)
MATGMEHPDGSPPVDDAQELHRLMEEIRAGSQEAVRELLEEYGDTLLFVIRRRLAPRLRRQFDSADFLQAVWASFFTVRQQQRHFDTPEALMSFLVRIATNKVSDAARQVLHAQKRGADRTCSLDDPTAEYSQRLIGPQPTPSQIVLAEEQWDRLLDEQPLPYRRVLELLREGHTQGEVAEQLRLSVKTVRRVVARAFELFEERDRQ